MLFKELTLRSGPLFVVKFQNGAITVFWDPSRCTYQLGPSRFFVEVLVSFIWSEKLHKLALGDVCSYQYVWSFPLELVPKFLFIARPCMSTCFGEKEKEESEQDAYRPFTLGITLSTFVVPAKHWERVFDAASMDAVNSSWKGLAYTECYK